MDKTLTPSPWTTPKNTISDEYYIKKLRFYTYTARTCIFLFRMAFSRHFELNFGIILNKQPLDTKSVDLSHMK